MPPSDIEDRKLTVRSPRSGQKREIVFIPQKVVADRLREYIATKEVAPDQQISLESCMAGRSAVKRLETNNLIRIRFSLGMCYASAKS